MSRLFVLAVLLSACAATRADGGLDLALLLDRSTSMARRSRSDDVLLRMTLDVLARNAVANRVEHRLAVIAFGSSASVDLPFTSIRDGQLRRNLDALHYTDRGDTDVQAAFELAERLFLALPANPQRRRAIVLLTDGVPNVRGADMSSYRKRLQQFAAARLAGNGITIDVILLDARDDLMWAELARVTRTSSTPEQLLPEAHGVIARLVGTRTAESAPAKTNPAVDTLIVPPYLEIIVFDIFRASRSGTVAIFPPDSASPIRAGAHGIESLAVGDVLTTLVVPRPEPGEWIIRKSRADARVRILSQQFFPRGMLSRPAETELLRRCTHASLAYRVLDGSGQPLEELHRYALSLDVTLTRPDGGATAIAMERDPALGAGVFRNIHEPFCDLAGRYWTDVRITTADAQGHRLEIFRDRWSGFSVASIPAHCNPPLKEKEMSLNNKHRMWIFVASLLGITAVAAWIRKKTQS